MRTRHTNQTSQTSQASQASQTSRASHGRRAGRPSVATTVLPTVCGNCGHLVSHPYAWVRLLFVLAPGRGIDETAYSPQAIGRKLNQTRARVHQLLAEALQHGVMERVTSADIEGVSLYRRTRYGRVLLNAWKKAGYGGSNEPGGARPSRPSRPSRQMQEVR